MSPRRLAALLALAGCAALAAGCASTARTSRDLADLTNPYLGPDYSQWLVGPIVGLANRAEVQAYLALRDDRAAAAYIEEFWRRRDPRPQVPDNPLRQLFDERCAEANRQFSEAGFSGCRTDRGTLFVLYGRPDLVDREINPARNGPPIEVWIYDPAKPHASLTGRPPGNRYRFVKRSDLTQFYRPVSRPVYSEPQ